MMMECSVMYCLQVLVAGLSVFMLGGVWYHPKVFGHMWGQEAHMKKSKDGHAKWVYAVALVFSIVSACAFSCVVGKEVTLERSMGMALVIGLCWVSTSFGINYFFAGRSPKMLLIDAGYHTVQFLVYGLIFGLWHA